MANGLMIVKIQKAGAVVFLLSFLAVFGIVLSLLLVIFQ